jgi:succinate-acetate transporter protein
MSTANPAPLGLCGFAFTTWLLSMINVGWFPAGAMPLVLASAFVFGGGAQFLAGLMEYPRANSFGLVAFCGYGSFWLTYGVFVEMHPTAVPAGFVAWFQLQWGVFTAAMFIASLSHNLVTQAIFAALTVTFVLLAWGEFTANAALHRAGGYFGLVTALLAFYGAMGQVINESHGRTICPLGNRA